MALGGRMEMERRLEEYIRLRYPVIKELLGKLESNLPILRHAVEVTLPYLTREVEMAVSQNGKDIPAGQAIYLACRAQEMSMLMWSVSSSADVSTLYWGDLEMMLALGGNIVPGDVPALRNRYKWLMDEHDALMLRCVEGMQRISDSLIPYGYRELPISI